MRDTHWGAILADISQIAGPLSAIFHLIEAHRNKVGAQHRAVMPEWAKRPGSRLRA
jgi:hypothetical protein